MVAQAELWLMETPNQKRRPVLIVSRDEAIAVLNNVVVAPVTSTIRDIPTCIPVGPDQGIDHDSVVTFDNLAAVPKTVLTTRLGELGVAGRHQICRALDAVANC
ncbi:MAG: putative endoribonuclease MazF5 [Acidimicrobiales bacterium]|nr:putative endoribonuclease MazF5 [Acidimicrobiales bacterium]